MRTTGHPWQERQALTQPQDRAAMAALQAQYTASTAGGRRSKAARWTRAEALTLGRLYVQAYGTVPTPGRMRPEWCLPSAKTIRGLFGAFTAYYAALEGKREEDEAW